MKLLVVSIFLTAYTLLVLKKGNPFIVLGGAVAALFVSRALSLQEVLASVNYNVLAVFWGTMVLSGLFLYSKVPAYLATWLVDRAKSVGAAMLYVCLLAGFISSFVENVATVLIVASAGIPCAMASVTPSSRSPIASLAWIRPSPERIPLPSVRCPD